MATILVTDFNHLYVFGNEPERKVKEKEKDKEPEKEKENKIENKIVANSKEDENERNKIEDKIVANSKEDENQNTEKVSLCYNFVLWKIIETQQFYTG